MPPANSRHLLHIFPTFAVGGSQIRFGHLVKLHGARYRHTVVALDGIQRMAENLSPDLPVEMCSQLDCKRGDVRQAIEIIDKLRPDALVTYNWGSFNWWLARKFRPALSHVHIEDGFGPDERDKQLLRRSWARRLILSDRKTEIILPSKTLMKIAEEKWSLSQAQLHFIPNGVDWKRFRAGRRDTGRDEITIGTVATLRSEKNIPRLIALYNQVAELRPELEIKLLIVGDGPEYTNIAQHVQRSTSRLRITLAGSTSTPQDFLEKMDIFALTSDTEQMPLSVLEAMATALPIIAFNVGDVADMVSVENRPAASIRHDDETGFVAHLVDLIGDRKKRAALGNANLAAVKSKFSVEKMALSYAALFG